MSRLSACAFVERQHARRGVSVLSVYRLGGGGGAAELSDDR